MRIWKNQFILSRKKLSTGALIFDSFKRYYPKTNPISIDKPVDNEDVEFHSKLADRWWDPRKNPLHALNEIRVPFIRNCIMNAELIYTTNSSLNGVLAGFKVLDVGCGGGILSEALGRLRCDVVGIDESSQLIEVAKQHATMDKLVEKQVKYENTDLLSYSRKHTSEFDLVVVSEVLEHIANKEKFLKLCADCLKDDGSLFITTPNRTFWSKLFLVELSEFINIVPPGTHDYAKFITPRELTLLLQNFNCRTTHIEGIIYRPWLRKFETNRSPRFMYALHAVKDGDKIDSDTFRRDNRLLQPCS